MAEELIRQYIDREAFRADTDFAKKSIEEVIQSFVNLKNSISKVGQSGRAVEVIPGISAMNTQLTQSIKLSKEEATARTLAARALKEEANARNANARTAKEEANAKRATTQASNAETAASERQTKAREKSAQASAREEKALREAQRSYKSLTREYEFLRKRAEDLGAALGVNSKQYIEAAKRANELNNRLKAIDSGIGNFQRNVGNYASGFGGLSNSINQITRELPAFSNSLQTGFLAISNNLPIFFDEIGRARQEITRLKEAGEKAPTVLQALGKSFFSLGTALSLGVTLLTIYGKDIVEFFGSLIKGTEPVNKLTEAIKIQGDVMSDTNSTYTDAVKTVSELRTKVDLAKQGIITKKEVVEQYNEKLGNALGTAKTFNEVEDIMSDEKRTSAYVKTMLLRASAQEAFAQAAKKAVEAQTIDLNFGEQLTAFAENLTVFEKLRQITGSRDASLLAAEINALRKGREEKRKQREQEVTDYEKIAADFLKKAGALEKEFNIEVVEEKKDGSAKQVEEAKKAALQLRKIRIEQQAAELEDIIASEGLGTKAREMAVKQRMRLLNDAEDVQRQINLLGEKKSREEIELINEQSAIAKANIARDGAKQISDIRVASNIQAKKAYDEDVKLWEDAQKEKTSISEQEAKEQATRLSNRQAALEQDRDIRLKALEGKRAAGLITEQQYNEQREKIINDSQEYLIRAEIDYVKAILAIRKEAGENTAQEEAKLAALELKLQKDKNDAKIKQDEAYQRTRSSKLKELQGELVNLFTSVVDGAFERQKNALQDQIDLIEIRKQREIEAVNASLLSEQEKADKISVLNARAAAEREALQRRQRQVDQERARFEKAASIARITQSTVEAVVATLGQKPWTPANIALSAIIGAIGAAQIARIIATPIPRYKTGTDNHPGGLAIVGDGGQREVVAMGGRAYLTPATDTMVDLPAGAKVYPSVDEFNATANKMIYKSIAPVLPSQVIDEGKLAELVLKGIDKMVGKIENLPLQSFTLSDGELKATVRRGNTTTEYINKHIKN